MILPDKKDLHVLKAINMKCEQIQQLEKTLNKGTQDFLLNEFNNSTSMHLINYQRNIDETIKEIEE